MTNPFRRKPLTVVISEGAPAPTPTPPAHIDLRTREQRLTDQAALDVALGLSGRWAS